MNRGIKREIEFLRTGFLTYYILKIIEGMPKVDMHPYYALIAQELESKNRLGSGKSLLFIRLRDLQKKGFLHSEAGLSRNPRAKKKVRFYSLSESGRRLLSQLESEQKRISDSLAIYAL